MRLTRLLPASLLSLSLLLAPACSDDSGGDPPADTSPPADTTTPADTAEDVADDTASADTVEVCEHPCLNEFGNNDKSLCPAPQSEWKCKQGCCEPIFTCATDADCAVQGFEEGQCTDERFACHCDVPSGECFTWFCGDIADCEAGQICAAGACVAEPAGTGLQVRILNRRTVLTTGATLTLKVDGVDPANPDLVSDAADATFASSDSAIVAVDAEGVLTGGAAAGTATITATLGATTATYSVRNVVPDAKNPVTAIVADEITTEPVAGRYAFLHARTGGVLEQGDIPSDGVIRYSNTMPLDGVDLHVFATDHDWISWLGLRGNALSLYLPVPRTLYSKVEMDMAGAIDAAATELLNVGVIAGEPDFSQYPRDLPMEISLTSFALSSALFDFNLQVLLGADVKRFVVPDSAITGLGVDPNEPITAPGGICFGLGGPAVPTFVLTAPEGKHRVWTLGGRLDLAEVAEYAQDIIDSVAGGDLDFTRIVGAVFPLFRVFWSGYLPEVEMTTAEETTTTDATPTLTMPLGLSSSLMVPALPAIDDLGYADALFMIGGALTVDGFMVPLGLNGGADTSDKEGNPPDGIADANERTPEQDPFILPLAPLHSGLASPHAAYTLAVVAVAIKGKDDPRPDAGSGLLVRSEPGEGPPAAPTLPDFLPFPTASTWDPGKRIAEPAAVAGADAQRLLFKGKKGAHWTIWLDGRPEVVVPLPADYNATTPDRASVDVQLALVNSLDLADGVELSDVMAPGGGTIDTLLGSVDRINFIDIKDAPPAEER